LSGDIHNLPEYLFAAHTTTMQNKLWTDHFTKEPWLIKIMQSARKLLLGAALVKLPIF
jgi:hypothetical protein